MLPGSINIAPPPLTRRKTPIPRAAASSRSTSLRRDWKDPMMTAFSFHSQKRSVGPRRPAPTSSVKTWSSAMCSAADSGSGARNSQSYSAKERASAIARRTAVATASGWTPSMTTSAGSASRTLRAISPASAVTGSPSIALVIASRASSGSRKKSPEMTASTKWPFRSSASTTISFPPGTLYSPFMPSRIHVDPRASERGRQTLLRGSSRCRPRDGLLDTKSRSRRCSQL